MNQIKFFYLSFLKMSIVTILLLISGCSTYSNKWKCSDARGLHCKMLSEVDEQINSGEIELVYGDACKTKLCVEKLSLLKRQKISAKKYIVETENDSIFLENDQLSEQGKEESLKSSKDIKLLKVDQ